MICGGSSREIIIYHQVALRLVGFCHQVLNPLILLSPIYVTALVRRIQYSSAANAKVLRISIKRCGNYPMESYTPFKVESLSKDLSIGNIILSNLRGKIGG